MKNGKTEFKYRLLNGFLIVLAVLFAGSIVRNLSTLSREDKILKDASDRLQTASGENQNLKRQLAQVKSPDFIEKEARNKLNLGKTGEVALILPQVSPVISPPAQIPDISPNWQKWLKLFF